MKKVLVVGMWHQGVVGAACMAELGYDVLGVDADSERVAALNSGRAPLFEPGLDELIRRGLSSGRLRFSDDLACAPAGRSDVMLMFDTPVDENDRSDLSGVFAAVAAMSPALETGVLLHVTAQVPVGTCHALRDRLRAARPGLDFGLSYSPENLRLGQAIERFMRPALPVIGADDDKSFDRARELLAPLNAEWMRVDVLTAEMTKHALNAFLAVSVCFANELGNICDEVGADGHRIAAALRMEPRVGGKAMLCPGLGFAGGTLARDMQTLRELGDRCGVETRLLDGAWDGNLAQNGLVLRRLRKGFGSLDGLRVAVLGLTYKPETSTLRRSAALEVIADLAREGAKVSAHDPRADRQELSRRSGFVFHETAAAAAKGARVIVLMTPWREYRELDLGALRGVMQPQPAIFDCPNVLDAEAVRAAGFVYMGIGRGVLPGGAQ